MKSTPTKKFARKCLGEDCGEIIKNDAPDKIQYCDNCWNDGPNWNREDGQ